MTAPSGSSQPSAPAGAGPSRGAVVAVVATAVVVASAVIGLAAQQLTTGVGAGRTPAADAVATAGASADGYTVWERNADGTPVRWDPCRPILLVHDPTDAPEQAAADLDEAIRRLRAATGLDLRVDGETVERPAADRAPFQPDRYGDRWAPVLVAWAEPGEGGVPLRDIDRGVGMPVAVGHDGDRTYVSGQVVLNAERDDLRGGFDDRATSWGATLLHELAHVVGLGHVDLPDELMHVHPGAGPVEFGAGDRAGLRAVGAAGGCRDVPEPGPVDVVAPER